ncbi:MAG: phosphomannomutase [Parcubacteria group bacterium Gr01-1014_38]|nr:MAG: phosphomannomutase [Parcubacteria group bacterium Gr01-1014_38]
MPFTLAIYRSYDIRGIVPDELDASDAENIGRAFVVHTGAKKVLVARDMRTTGPELHAALVRGITAQGADVVDVGLATTPLFYYSVWQVGADGGVMVSASHNPAQYNGFKMTKEQAKPISKDTGILAIRDLIEKGEFPSSSRTGSVSSADFSDGYLAYATAGADRVGALRIIVDTGNGMGGLLLPHVLERLPQVQATRMYFELDGSFPNHEANPLKEENMRDLQERVRTEHADLGVAIDGDGDRVGFTDENGVTVPGDLITAIIAQEVLREKRGAKILYDLRSSWATKEAIEAAGGIPVMSRVGHSYIKDLMRKEGAAFAGEMSSHFYFQEYYAESAIRAMVLLLRVLSERGQSFSQLVAPLKKYAKTPEINFQIEDKAAALAEAKRRYADGKQFELDGLSIEYPDWWFNLRASGTEPLLRLNMEARTQGLLEQKKAELFSFLGTPSSH